MPPFEVRRLPKSNVFQASEIPEGRLARRNGHVYLRTMTTLTCLDCVSETYSTLNAGYASQNGFELLPVETKIVIEIPE